MISWELLAYRIRALYLFLWILVSEKFSKCSQKRTDLLIISIPDTEMHKDNNIYILCAGY